MSDTPDIKASPESTKEQTTIMKKESEMLIEQLDATEYDEKLKLTDKAYLYL